MLIDVHTHLDLLEKEKDLDEVINKDKVKPALGMYPDKAVSLTDKEIDEEIKLIKKSNPVAIGEVGLDNFRVENIERQKEVLIKFINLAKELDIPIIVHSRKAEEETLKLLEENNAKKVIMHCFSGNKELTDKAIELNYYFTVPCSVTKNKTFRKLAKRIPLNKLLTETDAPYLSPREEPNEPAFIKDSIKKIAEIKQLTEEELEKIIFMNYQSIFLQ